MLYPLFAAGKRFLIQRAALTDRRGTTRQPAINETAMSAVRSQVDRLLTQAAHEHLQSLRKALRLLAESKLMNYTAPSRKRIGGALRLEVFAEVNAAVAEVTEDCDVVTGSSDGWDNISNTHFLSQMGMTRKGSFFKGGVNCTGVETMNKPWVFAHLEDLMILLCGLEKPVPEDTADADEPDENNSPGGDSGYESSEKELELLQKLTVIVLDGPNVNKGALKEFEKKYPWVSRLICACHCLSGLECCPIIESWYYSAQRIFERIGIKRAGLHCSKYMSTGLIFKGERCQGGRSAGGRKERTDLDGGPPHTQRAENERKQGP